MVVDAEQTPDRMDGDSPGAVGEQPAAASCDGRQPVVVEPGGPVGQQPDDGARDRARGITDRVQEAHDVLRLIAGGDQIDRELQQRRARHAEAVRSARLDEAGIEQVARPGRDEVGHEAAELVHGDGRAGLVEMDKLVGIETEDVTEVVPVAPRCEEIADAGERVAALLEPADELEPFDVRAPVDAQSTPPFRGGQQAESLVLPDGAYRDLGDVGELVDGEFRSFTFRLGVSHAWTVAVNTVTVNTVSNTSTDLLDVLRASTATPGLEYDGPPRPLPGGFWAELLAFRLRDAPAGWEGDLVVRVMPDAAIAGKESAVQAEVAALGFPTPAVHLVGGPDDGLGRAFMVMDLAAGTPLLDGLGGAGVVTALPKLARRLPDALGEAMATLHRLPVEAVAARLSALDGTIAYRMTDYLARLGERADAQSRDDLAAAVQWLRDNPPPAEPDVVCHGDLHPLNILIGPDGTVTVLDWSVALLAPAAFDVAFTSLLLSEPPVAVPRPVSALTRTAGRLLARRFRRSYTRAIGSSIDPESMRWHEGVVCLRALLEVAGWVEAGEIDSRRGHPWLLSGPAFARRLGRLTGVTVSAR